MFIKIRKENFGYVLYDVDSRLHHFVITNEQLEGLNEVQVKAFIAKYYQVNGRVPYSLIIPPANSFDLSAPIGMYLEIAQACNMQCKHCYKPAPEGKISETMSTEATKEVLKELKRIGVFEIRICGNEPTAAPNFFEICRYIQELGLYLGVNTNAYFSEEMQQRIVELAPNFIAISIDGNQITHDQIRRPGSYTKAISFLKKLSKTSIPRRINTMLSLATLKAMDHVVQLADENNAGVSFLPLRPVGKPTYFKAYQPLDKVSMYNAVREINRLRQFYPSVTLLTYFDILGEKALYHHSMDFNKPCPARKNGFIAHNGDFFPCDFLRYMGDRFYCGNVVEGGFWKIWSGSAVLHNFQQMEHDKCKTCSHYLTKCYGGCICGSLASNNTPDDELCFANLLPVSGISQQLMAMAS